ncbi:MAG: hypothetical protein Q7U04_10700 [Bacteriovorax sp.]|nr:hypothetical protein [Bacteriovorax sp.]
MKGFHSCIIRGLFAYGKISAGVALIIIERVTLYDLGARKMRTMTAKMMMAISESEIFKIMKIPLLFVFRILKEKLYIFFEMINTIACEIHITTCLCDYKRILNYGLSM